MSATQDEVGSMVKISLRRRKLLLLSAITFIGLSIIPNAAFASWLTYVGVGVFVVGAIVLTAGLAAPAAGLAIGSVVISKAIVISTGAALVVGGAGAVVKDQVVDRLKDIPPINRPEISAAPEPPAVPGNLLTTHLSPLPIPGNGADGVVVATNASLDGANMLIDDFLNNQTSNVAQDFLDSNVPYASMASEVESVFQGQESAGVGITSLSQADIDDFLTDVATSGLPQSVVDVLLNEGFDAAAIGDLENFLGSTPINLAVQNVTGSELLTAAANLSFIPEPSSFMLFSLGGVAMMSYGWQRRRRAA